MARVRYARFGKKFATHSVTNIEGKCLFFAKNRLNKDSAKAFCATAFGAELQGKIYDPNTTPP